MTTSNGLIDGFEVHRLPGFGIEIDALVGGSGPPLLLLHGFPETRRCWAHVAPALAERFTLVIPDLRGYGRSDKPPGDLEHNTYSKATLAKDQISTMFALGFSHFSVAGHGRGGRVAYRLALDFPSAVARLALLNILPTADAFASIDASTAIKLWHWFLQSQEGGLPERMIAAVVDEYVHALLQEPAGAGFIFDPVSVDDYLASFRDASCIHAACEDYRAAWYVDRILDERQEGKICLEAPLLLLWGREGALAERDPIKVWRKWASNIQGHVVPGGHFVPEEACRAVVEAFNTFFIEDNLNKASFI